MSVKPTILWFRNDLRLADNSALAAAIKAGTPIIPLYIWSPSEAGGWAPGAASKWFLHQALKSLDRQWIKRGGKLVLRQGDSLAELRKIINDTGAERVFWNRRYEPPQREIDVSIKSALRDDGTEVKSFNSSLLNEPHSVSTGSGKPYKVYTPYWRKVKDRDLPGLVHSDLSQIKHPKSYPQSLILDELKLISTDQLHDKLERNWEVSEAASEIRLTYFLERKVLDYHINRDIPKEDGTSILSPYLRWGLIGPRQVVHSLKRMNSLSAEGFLVYSKEIYWREFAYNVLYHFPYTPDVPLQEKYLNFPWQSNPDMLDCWQRGQTGYPIVDAGMRQLYETGWMHNRVRMIVSSFLVKHLLQDWHVGALWFWENLVDADLASNTLGWQWSGGCGADAAPFFRIFNPITQGQKFDSDGTYVRRWVPEIAKLPSKYIHEPWKAPNGVLECSDVILGKNYPMPVIEHSLGRKRALEALASLKNS